MEVHKLYSCSTFQGINNGIINISATRLTQIIEKPLKPHPIPDDWKIFISIASYRDIELIYTLRSLVSAATHPERLRIVVCNQNNIMHE